MKRFSFLLLLMLLPLVTEAQTTQFRATPVPSSAGAFNVGTYALPFDTANFWYGKFTTKLFVGSGAPTDSTLNFDGGLHGDNGLFSDKLWQGESRVAPTDTAVFYVSPRFTGNTNNRYSTIKNALAVADSGKTIFVYPGTYSDSLTLKNGVNVYCLPGVATIYRITDGGGSVSCTWSGYADIGSSVTTPVLNFSGSGTIDFTCDSISSTAYIAVQYAGSGTLNLHCNSISNTAGSANEPTVALPGTGTLNVFCPSITRSGTGTGSPVTLNGTGTLSVFNSTITQSASTNISAVRFASSGNARLVNCRIVNQRNNASAHGVLIDADPASYYIFENCSISLTNASANSFSSAAARSIAIYGTVWANAAKGDSVTITSGIFTVNGASTNYGSDFSVNTGSMDADSIKLNGSTVFAPTYNAGLAAWAGGNGTIGTLSSGAITSSGVFTSTSTGNLFDLRNFGTGTYNRTVVSHDTTNEFLWDVARRTNAAGGTPLDFVIGWRGEVTKSFRMNPTTLTYLGSISSGAITSSGDFTATATTFNLKQNTSDGSDNHRIFLASGGSNSTTRGAMIELHGNEYNAADSGSIYILTGNTTTADIFFYTQGTQRMVLDQSGALTGNTAIRDTSSFTTTATRKAVYIAGVTSTDNFTITHRNATGDDTLPVDGDLMSYYCKTDSLIVLRQAGTTSGMKFSFHRIK